MKLRAALLFSTLIKHNPLLQQYTNRLVVHLHHHHHQHQQCRTLVNVRLKWVKNRGLDRLIDTQTDLRAAYLIKNAINRSSTGFITAKSIADTHKLLGITVPTLRFIRRYPTLFEEFPHPRYPSLPCFRLTEFATTLHNQEQNYYLTHESNVVERLSRVLMMTKNQTLPLQSIHPLKWDLGLPDDFDKNLIVKYPDQFQVVKGSNGLLSLKLEQWRDEFAVSELQKSSELASVGVDYRKFKRGETALSFPMSFPRGYGEQTKVKAWMEEFQRLPYISPYDDSSRIDPNSDLMEKRVVGVLHEFLSLTMYKKTKRNNFRSLREELNLPHKFTRLFTRYPGIFYLSLKCKTTTITLKEGYERRKLLNPDPLVRLREKFYYVMNTGLVYRNKGLDMIPPLEHAASDEEEEYEEEEIGSGDEYDEANSDTEADSGDD